MKNLKYGPLFYIVLAVLAFAVPLLIVSAIVTAYAGSADLYKGGFARYRISSVTGISGVQLNEVARGMADYLNGKATTPQVAVEIRGISRPVYNQKELVHLEDVRRITDLFKVLGAVSLILLAAGLYLYFRYGLVLVLTALQAGSIATVSLLGAVMLWALADFDSIFYAFHIVSFSNDLWLLDPATDYLIMMFPEGFFFDSAVMVVATVIAAAVVLWLAAYAAKRIRLKAEK